MSGQRMPALMRVLLAVLTLAALAAPPSRADTSATGAGAPPPALRRELDRVEALLLVRLASLPEDSGVLILRDPERVVLRIPARLLFEPDSAELKHDPAAAAAITASVQLLKKRRRVQAQIIAYTDSIGSEGANQSLSEQRAQAVYDALSGAGIASNRLQQRGAGATNAVASNLTPQGRIENRRLEIEFRPGPAAAP
jgi:outer membrane protein OmpA-like peptidoglycan-associated protein